jgi:hypothetical protein
MLDINNCKSHMKGGWKMKKLLAKFESAMTAVAFAEAGEFVTACQMLSEDEPKKTGRPALQKRPAETKVLRAD